MSADTEIWCWYSHVSWNFTLLIVFCYMVLFSCSAQKLDLGLVCSLPGPCFSSLKQGKVSYKSLLALSLTKLCNVAETLCYAHVLVMVSQEMGPRQGEWCLTGSDSISSPVPYWRSKSQLLKTPGGSWLLILWSLGTNLVRLGCSAFPDSGLSPVFTFI